VGPLAGEQAGVTLVATSVRIAFQVADTGKAAVWIRFGITQCAVGARCNPRLGQARQIVDAALSLAPDGLLHHGHVLNVNGGYYVSSTNKGACNPGDWPDPENGPGDKLVCRRHLRSN